MTKAFKDLKDHGFNTANKVYVIAEIGINHGGSIDTAKKLIDSAARTGADAVKFQTYVTEKRTKKGSPIFDILKKCELPFKAFAQLKDYASARGIEFFSTPFDNESVDCLEDIGTNIYKIASFDVVNHGFLEKVAATKKTVILSTGMSEEKEVKEAYKILSGKTKNIGLLHCISAYPTQARDANIAAIYKLKDAFDCVVGQSDHTNGIQVPLFAVAAGAQIIEKHYKISDDMECIDAPVSITEKQMAQLVIGIRELELMLGSGDVGLTDAQKPCVIYRRFGKKDNE